MFGGAGACAEAGLAAEGACTGGSWRRAVVSCARCYYACTVFFRAGAGRRDSAVAHARPGGERWEQPYPACSSARRLRRRLLRGLAEY